MLSNVIGIRKEEQETDVSYLMLWSRRSKINLCRCIGFIGKNFIRSLIRYSNIWLGKISLITMIRLIFLYTKFLLMSHSTNSIRFSVLNSFSRICHLLRSSTNSMHKEECCIPHNHSKSIVRQHWNTVKWY